MNIETKVKSLLRISMDCEHLRGFLARAGMDEVVLHPVFGARSYFSRQDGIYPRQPLGYEIDRTIEVISSRISPPLTLSSYFSFPEGTMQSQADFFEREIMKYYDCLNVTVPAEDFKKFLFEPHLVFWKDGLFDNRLGKLVREKIAVLHLKYCG